MSASFAAAVVVAALAAAAPIAHASPAADDAVRSAAADGASPSASRPRLSLAPASDADDVTATSDVAATGDVATADATTSDVGTIDATAPAAAPSLAPSRSSSAFGPPGDAESPLPGEPVDDATGHAYLEPGIALGVTRGALYGAIELDGGYHLGSTPFWLHGRFAQGALAVVEDSTMTSDFTEARLGLETRGCLLDGIACLVGGVDFGYRHEMLTAHHARQTSDVAVAIARVGLDVGGKHLRIRPSIETGVEPGGWNGLGLTAGIAYTW